MFGGVIATVVGPRYFIIASMWIAAPIYLACAANPLNLSLTMGLITTGSLAIGAGEAVSATTTTFKLRTQEEIGTAGGLSGAIRSFVSVLATAIYSTVLQNRLGQTIPHYVTPAAEQAGLPKSSVSALIEGLSGAAPLTASATPGLTSPINATVAQAYKVANAEAYKTVFYTSFAFGGIGMIICWLVANNDESLNNYVAGHVHKTTDEKELQGEKRLGIPPSATFNSFIPFLLGPSRLTLVGTATGGPGRSAFLYFPSVASRSSRLPKTISR